MLRIAVLLSGSGTTLENLLNSIDTGVISAEIIQVISSKKNAFGLIRAQKRNIPTATIASTQYKGDFTAMSKAIWQLLDNSAPDLVCLAGFMCKLDIPDNYLYRVINIHPALLPSFGGKGMFGHNVHQAVVASGVKLSGCTVHFCDNQYDHGPIILQRACPVTAEDTAESVQQRVFAEECIAYPQAIQLFSKNRLQVIDNIVHIR